MINFGPWGLARLENILELKVEKYKSLNSLKHKWHFDNISLEVNIFKYQNKEKINKQTLFF